MHDARIQLPAPMRLSKDSQGTQCSHEELPIVQNLRLMAVAGLVSDAHYPDQRQETVHLSGWRAASGAFALRSVQISPMGHAEHCQAEHSTTVADSEPSESELGRMADLVVQMEVPKVQIVKAIVSNCQFHYSNYQVDLTLHET